MKVMAFFHNRSIAELPRRFARTGQLAALTALAVASPAIAQVEVLSVGITGRTADAASQGSSTNLDGSVVAFYSDASNLVTGDTNGARDVFVYDRRDDSVTRISVGSDGAEGEFPSHADGGAPMLSADGNLVAFYSNASTLVAYDTNGAADIFLHTRDTGTDRATGVTELISRGMDGQPANGASVYPSISADGNLIAFQSYASNLVPNDTNDTADIFIHNRATGTTVRACNRQPNRASVTPAISPDGTFVVFASSATDLVAGDTNGKVDVFRCNLATNEIDRVSIGDMNQQGDGDSIVPDVSLGGCVVGFKSLADNLVPRDLNQRVDVFARDIGTGRTELISHSFEGGSANDASYPPTLSGNGRFVAFGSVATDLLKGDENDVASAYLHDRGRNTVRLIDINARGRQANGEVPDAPLGLSLDGKVITFASKADNLDSTVLDRNLTYDVFSARNNTAPAVDGTICCDCGVEQCTDASDGLCPTGCMAQCGAICDVTARVCVPLNQPSPTPTGTTTATTTATATATATHSQTPRPTETATRTPVATATTTPTTVFTNTTTATPRPSATNTAVPSATRPARYDDDGCAIQRSEASNLSALGLLAPAVFLVRRRRR